MTASTASSQLNRLSLDMDDMDRRLVNAIPAEYLAETLKNLRGEWREAKASGNRDLMTLLQNYGELINARLASPTGEPVAAPVSVNPIAPVDPMTTFANDVTETRDMPALVGGPSIPNGTYTVVFGSDDNYLTLQVADDFRADAKPGSQMLKYLRGADNDTDFEGCAFVTGQTLVMWKRFRGGALEETMRRAIAILKNGTVEDRLTAMEAYAMRSGRCAACGRTLTVPTSLHRGLGPTCAEKYGVA